MSPNSRLQSGGVTVDAVTFQDGRIIVKENLLLAGGLIRHEMLHALLPNVTEHPSRAFQVDCAGIVACADSCRRAGDVVPVDTLHAVLDSVASLNVVGHSAPQLRDLSSTTAWLSVVVGIRSTRSWPARISQTSGISTARETYSMALVRARDGLSLFSSSVLGSGDTLTLPALGQQKQVFDLNVSTLYGAARGEKLRLVVGYLGKTAVVDSLVVP